MARRPAVAARAKRHVDRLDDARLQRRRRGVRPPMGEVQDALRDQRRRPVRRHIGQPDAERRDRHRCVESHRGDRHAQDRQRLDQWRSRERHALRFVRAEVAGEPVRRPPGAPRQGTGRSRRRAMDKLDRPGLETAALDQPSVGGQRPVPGRRSLEPGTIRPRASGPATAGGTAPAARSHARTRPARAPRPSR